MFTTQNPIAQYSGNDSTVEFALNHKFYDAGDIVVVLQSVAGAYTIQTITTHYTLAGIVTAPSDITTCTVTMGTAPASGETLTIYRTRDFTQALSLISGDGWHDIPTEKQFDYIVMQIQWLGLQMDKAVKYNQATTATPLTGEEMAALGEGILDGAFGWYITGFGAAITAGTLYALVEVPYDCTIEHYTLVADQSGSIIIDVWAGAYADFPLDNGDSITASAPPTLSTAQKDQVVAANMTGWTLSLTKGMLLIINVDSATTVEQVSLIFKVLKSGS